MGNCKSNNQLTKRAPTGAVAEQSYARRVETSRRDSSSLTRVNQYLLGRMLGRGAFGTVFEGTDDQKQLVAIKVLDSSVIKKMRVLKRAPRSSHENAGRVREMQLREIAVMKKLSHSNTVALFEVIDDIEHDRTFLVMELLRGGTVMEQMNMPPGLSFLPEPCARAIFRDLLTGLSYLHDNHVLHRDIKPENLGYTEHPEWARIKMLAHTNGGLKKARSEYQTASADERRAVLCAASAAAHKRLEIESLSLGIASRASLFVARTQSRSLSRKQLTKSPENPISKSLIDTTSSPKRPHRRNSQPGEASGRAASKYSDDLVARVKLLDFGVSHMCNDMESRSPKWDFVMRATGTPAFFAPEMLKKGGYRGCPADIWAAGVTLCILCSGDPPFSTKNTSAVDMFNRIKYDGPTLPSENAALDGSAVSEDLVDILRRMLEKDPAERITLAELREHPWVTHRGAFPLTYAYEEVQVDEAAITNAVTPIKFVSAADVAIAKTRMVNKLKAARSRRAERAEEAPAVDGEGSDTVRNFIGFMRRLSSEFIGGEAAEDEPPEKAGAANETQTKVVTISSLVSLSNEECV